MNELIENFVSVIKSDHDIYSYSGRGMYGNQCLAITISKEDSEAGVVADIMSRYVEDHLGDNDVLVDNLIDIADFFHGSKTDSMGLDTVMYFPSIEWQEEWNNED